MKRRRRSTTNDDQIITASLWIIVIAQTIGSVDMPGRGSRKMPAPRAYVAIVTLWGILTLAADFGFSKLASRAAAAAALTGIVLGPFGPRLVSFLDTVANAFPVTATTGAATASSGTTAGPPGVTPAGVTGTVNASGAS